MNNNKNLANAKVDFKADAKETLGDFSKSRVLWSKVESIWSLFAAILLAWLQFWIV
jgi:hypothetical protein